MSFKNTKIHLTSILALGMFAIFLLAPVLWATIA
tara:strand:- start:433 stop:534 length:102 start_codon:yes stop_codon:yes gene_type:complete